MNSLKQSILALSTLHIEQGTVYDEEGNVFDAQAYSKFKYGDARKAERYGIKLAQEFIKQNQDIFLGEDHETNFIIAEHPRKYILKGANVISRHFQNYLNLYLVSNGKNPIMSVPIFMSSVFEGDYGTFDKVIRDKVMSKQQFFTSTELFQNKHIILVDDIRITGTGERKIASFLEELNPESVHFLYVAKLNQNQADSNPEIESLINHVWMNDPERLIEIMNTDYFALNARVAKHVLTLNGQTLVQFLSKITDTRIKELYFAVISDGYSVLSKYGQSYGLLEYEFNKLFRN